MDVTRRTVLHGLGAATALLGASGRVWARQTLTLGERTVETLSDGFMRLPGNLVFEGLPKDELAAILADHGNASPDGVEQPCTLTLLRDAERTVLFDVGAGPNFMATTGRLAEALDAIDLDPGDVTHVVFTHAHPDHLWGVLDEFDDPLFPEAAYLIDETEHAYWTDPGTVNTIGELRQAFAAGAARYLAAIEDSLTLFRPDQEILPGVLARSTPGHTPGHTSFQIDGGSQSVMVLGDAIANAHVAFERPDWEFAMDQDPPRAAAARVALLDQMASERMRLIGFHLPQGGVGFAQKAGSGYRFVAG